MFATHKGLKVSAFGALVACWGPYFCRASARPIILRSRRRAVCYSEQLHASRSRHLRG